MNKELEKKLEKSRKSGLGFFDKLLSKLPFNYYEKMSFEDTTMGELQTIDISHLVDVDKHKKPIK